MSLKSRNKLFSLIRKAIKETKASPADWLQVSGEINMDAAEAFDEALA